MALWNYDGGFDVMRVLWAVVRRYMAVTLVGQGGQGGDR